jgi:hypothetical protein
LNIFILAESCVEAVIQLTKNWDFQDRFLECLIRVAKGNIGLLQTAIIEPLETEDVKVRLLFNIAYQ